MWVAVNHLRDGRNRTRLTAAGPRDGVEFRPMEKRMKKIALSLVALLLAVTTALAQRPSDTALLIPETAPELDYVHVPNAVTLPDGMKMGATAAVAFDARGH